MPYHGCRDIINSHWPGVYSKKRFFYIHVCIIKTLWYENAFRIIGPMCRISTCHQWIPLIKGGWCFFCCQPNQAVEQTVKSHVVWDDMTHVWRHCHNFVIDPRDGLDITPECHPVFERKFQNNWKCKSDIVGVGGRTIFQFTLTLASILRYLLTELDAPVNSLRPSDAYMRR